MGPKKKRKVNVKNSNNSSKNKSDIEIEDKSINLTHEESLKKADKKLTNEPNSNNPKFSSSKENIVSLRKRNISKENEKITNKKIKKSQINSDESEIPTLSSLEKTTITLRKRNSAKEKGKNKVSQKITDTNSENAEIINLEEIENTSLTNPAENEPLTENYIKNEINNSDSLNISSKVSNTLKSNDSSSEDSEWEDVEEHNEQDLDDYNPVIPKEGIEITINDPTMNFHSRKKKEFDHMDFIRLHINRIRKDNQIAVHKVHLLCLISHGFLLNNLLNTSLVRGIALSLIPNNLLESTKVDKIDINGLKNIVLWFRDNFSFCNERTLFLQTSQNLIKDFSRQKAGNMSEYNIMFIVLIRILGFKARLCLSLYPLTYKASNLIKKSQNNKKSDKTKKTKTTIPKQTSKLNDKSKSNTTSKSKKINKSSSDIKIDENMVTESKRPRRSKKINYDLDNESGDDDQDEDFETNELTSHKKNKQLKTKNLKNNSSTLKKQNRKILSSDSESSSNENSKSNKIVCWAEIYLKTQKRWIVVECVNNILDKPYEVEKETIQPITYILAYDNSYVKDVTRRYCTQFMTVTRKLRFDPDWWEETLEPFLPPDTKADREEEKSMDMNLANQPMPSTIAEFKNHPLYALERHLLKFEALYPPDAPPIGFIRKEPVYARECVHQLHTRETWYKEARVVRPGEKAYKVVKARPKWDKVACVVRTDLPLDLFGYWQTEKYKPPTAKNGIVPKNEYGNVELFKRCMLPKGTVHLQISGLNRIARKLGIDCCPAVTGFDSHKGSIHPIFDGFVVCEEYKDTLLAAWEEEEENARKKEEEKREKRIYGNWRKLIKGLLIREKIKLKYYADDE